MKGALGLLFCWLSLAPSDSYLLSRTPTPESPAETAGAALPAEIPEAFAAKLRPQGWRLSNKDGKPLYDLWVVQRLEVMAEPDRSLGLQLGEIAPGALFGVLRSFGDEVDYRDNPIDPAYYALRYAIQPSDGNHLGSSDSRDFLLLTGFEHDKNPARLTDPDELFEMAVEVAFSEHAGVLYLVQPEGKASTEGQAPRLYQRSGKEEWALDLTLVTTTAGVSNTATGTAGADAGSGESEEASKLRCAVVLVGITEEF
jgi:hypothetical protein